MFKTQQLRFWKVKHKSACLTFPWASPHRQTAFRPWLWWHLLSDMTEGERTFNQIIMNYAACNGRAQQTSHSLIMHIYTSEFVCCINICFMEQTDVPLAHTPLEAAWQPCFQTSWPHTQECLVWLPAEPSQPPHPSCSPKSGQWKTGTQRSRRDQFVNISNVYRWNHWAITRILSKAEGVPPLCTWPKMVVRVSTPSFFDISWIETL